MQKWVVVGQEIIITEANSAKAVVLQGTACLTYFQNKWKKNKWIQFEDEIECHDKGIRYNLL